MKCKHLSCSGNLMDAAGWGIRKKKGEEGRPYKCTKCKSTFYITKKERQTIVQQQLSADSKASTLPNGNVR